MSGPFYFAWVDPDQSTFDESTMSRFDEDVFAFAIKHDEGQFATMDATIKNPRVGLLNAGRKLWAWLAYKRQDNAHIVPLFFGVVTGLPTDLFAEMVQLKFNARPHDFIVAKQDVAETLKVRPFYDPVFLDETHRDDPDAILEGWSALYHIDRITHEVTVSDILEGEDGTVTFGGTQGLYDSVKMELGEAPLSAVQVQAGVQWTQRYTGFLPQIIEVNVTSYTGSSFKSDWPKPGSELGGGWKCEASFVTDILGTEHAKSTSNSSNWQNTDPDSEDCSTESMSVSVSSCPVPGIAVDGTSEGQTGICDPDGENADGSIGVNVPMKLNSQGSSALLWQLNCKMALQYAAKRDFSEQVQINVAANVQATVVSPLVDQNTEVLKISGANVGLPLISINAWSDFRNQFVAAGQMIQPNDRKSIAGTAFQVCVQAGTAGAVEPVFSDIPGVVTFDGTVRWASLGESAPTTQPAWADSAPIPTGEIVLYEPKIWNDDSGQFELTGQSCYLLCIEGGTTNSTWVDFVYFPTITSNDDGPPAPINTAYIPAPGQTSAYVAPITPQGDQVRDGSVVWLSLGSAPAFMGIPIGGTTETVAARSYFTKDRGHWSIEYLICKARARLRLRSRCAKVSWDAPFEDCLDLSLRKNAILQDDRIPGGQAFGKITTYTLTADQDGKLMGHVEMGCSVGYDQVVSPVDGTPEYALPGYAQRGWQVYDGAQVTLTNDEIAYSPPAFQAFDDGLSFPLQSFPGQVIMTTPDQVGEVQRALAAQGGNFFAANATPINTDKNNSRVFGGHSAGSYIQDTNPIEYALSAAPVACEIIIHPVTNGPFNGNINVDCSLLELPQGIDLSADSVI